MFNQIWEWIKEKIFSIYEPYVIPVPNIDPNMLTPMIEACGATGYAMEQMSRAVITMNNSLTHITSYTPLGRDERVIHIRCEYCHTRLDKNDYHCPSCGAPT